MVAQPGRAGVAVSGRRWLLLALACAAVALLLGRALAQIYTDYLWYAALGAADVWRAKYASLLALRLLCAGSATLFVFVNLYAVRQSVVSLVLPRRIGNLDIGEEVPRRQLTWTAAGLSALIGVALAWPQNNWSELLAVRVGKPFGESDPYFASDLGFFVHRLPFELSLFRWSVTVAVIVIGLVILLYALTPSLRWEQGRLYVSGYVRRHLAMLAGGLLLLLAWHHRLEMYTILGDGRLGDGAFGYIDHRVGIPASLLLALVALGAGLTVLWGGWTGQLRLVFAALTGVIIATLTADYFAPFLARRAMADRDVTVRERPYEATRAGYTRRAFAVDRVMMADPAIAFESLADAAPFVPLWDGGALQRATNGTLSGTGIGWVASDSGITAIVATRGGDSAFPTYVTTAAADNGTPLRQVQFDRRREIPPPRILPDTNVRPIIVADSTGEIMGPLLASSLSRLAHAFSLQDFRVLLGELPSPSPRLLSRRTVRERVGALAPFFAQGSTITPIWVGGALSWSVELYSVSRTYPLSRQVIVAGAERSYFQHAATALVNATTGRTVLVADSLPDPIAASWMERFPRLFERAAALPLSVRRQLPPPRESARAQASAFGRFGLRGEREVERHLPDDEGPDSALVLSPAPLMAFPGAGTTGYVLPLLDRGERVRGLFIALGGPSPRSLWLPIPEPAPVWSEALDRLRSVDTITAPHLVRGYVRAVPVAGTVVLAQPRYDWRTAGEPRLLYVSALVADSVITARTLLEIAGQPPAAAPAGSDDFRARVGELYDEMRDASARGDWAAYGRAFDALGALLARTRAGDAP
ncbi:MAG: UPF0182 family protein [Gemmatimonadaceae bacterium]